MGFDVSKVVEGIGFEGCVKGMERCVDSRAGQVACCSE